MPGSGLQSRLLSGRDLHSRHKAESKASGEGAIHVKPPTVVIVNSYGDENKGSAALNFAALDAVRLVSPDARLTIIAIRPTDVAQHYCHTREYDPLVEVLPPPVAPSGGCLVGLRTIIRQSSLWLWPRRPNLPDSLVRIREADLVLGRGGYVFAGRKGLRSAIALLSTAFPLIYARRVGVPTLSLPQSFGPISGRAASVVASMCLRSFDVVVARDEQSRRTARDLGVPTEKLKKMPDSVFLLDHREQPAPLRGPYLAISERAEQPGVEGAKDLLVSSVVELWKTGSFRSVVGSPQSAGDVDPTSEVTDRIGRAIGPGVALTIRDDLSPHQLMTVYAGAKVVLSHHLHACILSMISGTPAVAISVDGSKVEGVYQDLGLPAQWVVTRDANPGRVAEVVLSASRQRDMVRARVAVAKEGLRRALADEIGAIL